MLDESIAGLGTCSRHAMWELVRMLHAKGTTIFLTTHYIEEAETLCDHVGIIDNGCLATIGTVDELRNTIGRVALDVTDDSGRTTTIQHSDRDAARAFVKGMDPGYVSIRKTTLKNVFLEMIDGERGRLQ